MERSITASAPKLRATSTSGLAPTTPTAKDEGLESGEMMAVLEWRSAEIELDFDKPEARLRLDRSS